MQSKIPRQGMWRNPPSVGQGREGVGGIGIAAQASRHCQTRKGLRWATWVGRESVQNCD
jgi:hypothetical protein